MAPLAAQAEIMGQDIPDDAMPSSAQIHKARRKRVRQKAKEGDQGQPPAGKEWLDLIQLESQQNAERLPRHFDWNKLRAEAPWMPVRLLAPDAPQPCQGCVLLMSKNQVELTRRLLESGQNGTGKVLPPHGKFAEKVRLRKMCT